MQELGFEGFGFYVVYYRRLVGRFSKSWSFFRV